MICIQHDFVIRRFEISISGIRGLRWSLFAGYVQTIPTLRLANLNDDGCGRVEVLYQGQWGTVCDNDWDDTDATVACRQLGLGFASSSRNAAYGQGVGTIWIANVACTGTETSLESCLSSGWGMNFCTHSDDAGVCCSGINEYSDILMVDTRDSLVLKMTFKNKQDLIFDFWTFVHLM